MKPTNTTHSHTHRDAPFFQCRSLHHLTQPTGGLRREACALTSEPQRPIDARSCVRHASRAHCAIIAHHRLASLPGRAESRTIPSLSLPGTVVACEGVVFIFNRLAYCRSPTVLMLRSDGGSMMRVYAHSHRTRSTATIARPLRRTGWGCAMLLGTNLINTWPDRTPPPSPPLIPWTKRGNTNGRSSVLHGVRKKWNSTSGSRNGRNSHRNGKYKNKKTLTHTAV